MNKIVIINSKEDREVALTQFDANEAYFISFKNQNKSFLPKVTRLVQIVNAIEKALEMEIDTIAIRSYNLEDKAKFIGPLSKAIKYQTGISLISY